jgi:signal transduction histidine kinase
MRDYAEDLCASAGIELRFASADEGGTTALDARLKRQVFVVFKESVNNAVKHAHCSCIETRVGIADGWLSLTIADDGKGIAATPPQGGHGLANLKRRAAELHGSCEITSAPPGGTTIAFRVPLRQVRGSGLPA